MYKPAASLALLSLAFFISAAPMWIHAEDATLSATCDDLFRLPNGTLSFPADKKYLNEEVCGAYKYLITKYDGYNGKGVTGLENAKVQGITKLNPVFAVNLSKMMKAAEASGINLRILSAYRTCAGQQAVNPRGFGGNCGGSSHVQGKAVDFTYNKNDCSSPTYKWIVANSKSYKIAPYNEAHSYVPGECNHVEDISGASGTGPGGGTSKTPTGMPNPLRDITRPFTSPMPAMPSPPPPGQGTSPQPYGTCYPEVYCYGNRQYNRDNNCIDTLINTCQYGCSGNQCAAPPNNQQQPPPGGTGGGGTGGGGTGTGGSGTGGSGGGTIPQTPPPPGNTTPYDPGSCVAQYLCGNGSLYFRSYSCVDRLVEACQWGCANAACRPKANTGTTTSTTTPLSVEDILNMLANGTSTATTTAVLVTSPITAEVIAELRAHSIIVATTTQSPQVFTVVMGTTSSTTGLLIPDNTFGPPTPAEIFAITPGSSNTVAIFVKNILSKVRAILEILLPFIQPFGISLSGASAE